MALGCSGEVVQDHASPSSWVVEASPSVVIGLGSNDPPDATLHIVADATRLSDGSFVIANGGLESRLPVFGPDGEYLRTIGRLGDGPGEFRWVTSLESGPGDSLYIYDASLQRLTALSEDGPGRTTPFRVSGGGTGGDALRVVSRLDDHRWVALGLERPMSGGEGEVLQDTVPVGVMDGRLEGFVVLERVPGLTAITFEIGGRGAFGPIAFSPQALLATWGQCVFVAHGATADVAVYSATGDLLDRIQGPGEPREVTEDLKDAWIEDRLQLVDPSEQGILRQAYADVPWLEQLPYYNQMVVDEWGRVWLQEYAPPTGLGHRWYVLTQSGDLLGDVILPSPMRVFEITEHGILGSTRGEFDEERVELVPLEWPPRSSGAIGACS